MKLNLLNRNSIFMNTSTSLLTFHGNFPVILDEQRKVTWRSIWKHWLIGAKSDFSAQLLNIIKYQIRPPQKKKHALNDFTPEIERLVHLNSPIEIRKIIWTTKTSQFWVPAVTFLSGDSGSRIHPLFEKFQKKKNVEKIGTQDAGLKHSTSENSSSESFPLDHQNPWKATEKLLWF